MRTDKLLASLKAGYGVLLLNPSNMFYFTGYTGEGMVAFGDGFRAIITDSRYTEQATQQAPSFEVLEIGKGKPHFALAAGLFEAHGVKNIYFEDDYLTMRQGENMKKAMPDCTFEAINGAPEKLREIKDDSEVAAMEAACKLTSEAFDFIITQIHAGMTERQVMLLLNNYMMERGSQGTAFSTIIAAGAHGSLPHAVPGDYVIQTGDMVTMDYGAKIGGYCADMTRTVAVGTPSDTMLRVYETVQKAQAMAEEALAPGKVCSDIDFIARDYIDKAGYAGKFGHGLGHAVGIDIHESPRLSYSCQDILVPGIVMTVEPGIYLPGIGGVRIENSCLITNEGSRPLTTAPRDLIIL